MKAISKKEFESCIADAELISYDVSCCGTTTWKYRNSEGKVFVKRENGDDFVPVWYYEEKGE